jgi:hypothetical protein
MATALHQHRPLCVRLTPPATESLYVSRHTTGLALNVEAVHNSPTRQSLADWPREPSDIHLVDQIEPAASCDAAGLWLRLAGAPMPAGAPLALAAAGVARRAWGT